MQKFILDKSFLIGCKGDEIEKSDDLILCSVLLYELKKEIKKEPKTKKQMKKRELNIKALEKLFRRKKYPLCISIQKILKFESLHLAPISIDKLLVSLSTKNKKDFHSSLKVKNLIENEKENIQTMAALVIAVTSDENLLSIFEKKEVSEIDNLSINDISPKKINECFKYICNHSRIKLKEGLSINENWGSYFYCKTIMTLALYIRKKYAENINEIKTLSKEINAIITKNTSGFSLKKSGIEKLNNIEIFNPIVHDMADHLYLIYAGLIRGIKTDDRNIKKTAKGWEISVQSNKKDIG